MKIKVTSKLSKGDIVKAILGAVSSSRTMNAAFVAPNVLEILKKLDPTNTYSRRREIIQRSRDNLIKQGMMEKNEKGFIRLTSNGQDLLASYEQANYELRIPHLWDKKWRMLIFDIPEQRKGQREKIRNTLIDIGFMRLQDSVWVFPYDCSELVALLKADLKVGKDLQYLIVESIENDISLKKNFKL